MLSFLFNRFSMMVTVMEAAGIVLMAIAAGRILGAREGAPKTILVLLVLCLYAFIRFCASRRFYADAPRWSGVELQFKKAMVPTSYTMAMTGFVMLLWPSAVPLVVAAFVLIVVAHVNVILLYLRAKDDDPLPVNYFTSGRFLEDDAIEARHK